MRDETLRLVVLVGFFVGVVLFAAVCHELKSLQNDQAELDSECTASIVEEFTSNHSGITQGYVLIHFPGMGKHKDLTFHLHESRAKELAEKINGCLAGLPRLMEEE